jgi:YHS domain-containing protein
MRRWLGVGIVLFVVILMVGCAAKKQSVKRSVSPQDMVTCAVCGKETVKDLKLSVGYHGEKYWFCSQECLDRFHEDPSRFLEPEEGSEGGGSE